MKKTSIFILFVVIYVRVTTKVRSKSLICKFLWEIKGNYLQNNIDIRKLEYYYIWILASRWLNTPPSSFGGIYAVFMIAFFLPAIFSSVKYPKSQN